MIGRITLFSTAVLLFSTLNGAHAQRYSVQTRGAGVKLWKVEATAGVLRSAPLQFEDRSSYLMPHYYGEHRSKDTTMSGTATQQYGFHAAVNTNHLLMRVSDNSMFSFSVGLDLSAQLHHFSGFYASFRTAKERPLMAGQLGAPLTLDYKWGCDVDYNADLRGCFAIGAGAMPLVSQAYFGERSDRIFRVAPYVYASAGFYAWGCWKVRASFIPGTSPIMTDASATHDDIAVNTLNVQAKNTFTIGLSRMLRSQNWRYASVSRGGGIQRRLY